MNVKNHKLIDFPIILSIFLICLISLIVLYSSGGQNNALLIKHGIHIGLAMVCMLVVSKISPSTLESCSPYIYGLGLLVLLTVLSIGSVVNGAKRWVDLWVFQFQPAETMKIALPMMITWIFTRSTLPPPPLLLVSSFVVVLFPTVLVMIQPDLGTALLVASTGIIVIFLSGVVWKFITAACSCLALISPILWVFLLKDYQKRRILTLLNPWNDALGAGYHTIQSIIAVGSGGLSGNGWLSGTQSQLDFLPERNTDFIFAVYAEEFGLIGNLTLIALYLFLVVKGIKIAFNSQDHYSKLLTGSLSVTFFLCVFVNMSMVLGLLPVVGVPLPFMSYGGTSMVTLMTLFGILLSIDRHKKLLSGSHR